MPCWLLEITVSQVVPARLGYGLEAHMPASGIHCLWVTWLCLSLQLLLDQPLLSASSSSAVKPALNGGYKQCDKNPTYCQCRLTNCNKCTTEYRMLHMHICMSIQFSSVAQSCPTLCDPMNRSTPGLPVHHQLPEFTQTHVHRVGDAIQPSHPLSSPSPPAPNPSQHQGLFQWVKSSHEVAKVLEFQLQHQSFQWTPRTDLLSDGLVGVIKDIFLFLGHEEGICPKAGNIASK